MKIAFGNRCSVVALIALGWFTSRTLASDVLQTSSYTTCLDNGTIEVEKSDVKYVRSTHVLTFNVAGTSTEVQNVTATLSVTAYGNEYYKKSFNPCETDTHVAELCPVPSGSFSATGEMTIPDSYADMIPSIAFSFPDVDAQATIILTSVTTGEEVACVKSNVSNGKTVNLAAVSYVAAAMAASALLVSSFSAIAGGSSSAGGGHHNAPDFSSLVGWFQCMATNGMLSVKYPTIYRSFTQNFAFSTGLVPWDTLQTSIDNFRAATGGNLTEDSVEYLRNATLVYTDGSSISKRALQFLVRSLVARSNVTTSNSTSTSSSDDDDSELTQVVSGIKAYAEELTIPQANVFMTVLLVFAIVLASIAVGILLFKVILEAWALFGSFPQKLTSFRKHYWSILAKTTTQLVLLLYGVWVIYCVYQFTNGDSWAAKTLAAVTLCAFTGLLGWFTFRIWQIAQRYKKSEGDASILFEDKETWRKYNFFYENYKKSYWWLFVPSIAYMFAKGVVIAAGEGHGMVQSAGQLIIESLMFCMLLWNRPYVTGASNWINITISAVRVISVICVLVFVEELGISQTTTTITGVILIAIQSALTGVLAILIGVNAIITCVKENPHRKRRKEAALEKMNRDFDNLTPLDARNSLLMEPTEYKDSKAPLVSNNLSHRYSRTPMGMADPYTTDNSLPERRRLVEDAADMGRDNRSASRQSDRSIERAPRLPNLGLGRAY